MDNTGNTIKPSLTQIQQIKTSLYFLLADYYPQNVKVKSNGEKDGGFNESIRKPKSEAGIY